MRYWRKAGQRAVERSAHAEAIGHFTTGLELLTALPDTPERVHQELRLQIALGTPLIATKGVAVPEVEYAYARAFELCRQVGETPQLFPVLGGLCAFYLERAELQTAEELAQQLLRLAQRVHDPLLLLWAYSALGSVYEFRGECAAARHSLEQSLALYDPRKRNAYGFVHDPKVGCLSSLASVLFTLGYPDQALQKSDEALAWARELAHPYTLAEGLSTAAGIHWMRGEQETACRFAESLLALSDEQGFVRFSAYGTFLHGCGLVNQGQYGAGIARMRQGMVHLQAMTGRPWAHALLAEMYGTIGQAAEGLQILDDALTTVHEQAWESELYRLKGELLVQQSRAQHAAAGVSVAEASLQTALTIARRQQARSLELRAVMSLARLWQQQGKKAEARQMLVEIYGWFTEGFDTTDLQEARTLLDELTERPA